MESFVRYLELYEVITEEDKALYGRPALSVTDPAKRRELKIKQYKREKDIKARIEVCPCTRRNAPREFTRHRPCETEQTEVQPSRTLTSSSSHRFSLIHHGKPTTHPLQTPMPTQKKFSARP